MNSEESSSSSFCECFLSVVCSRRAWYLTGNPYLEQKTSNNPMYTSELEIWNCFNNLAHTWELTQQTPLMLSNESRQQTTHWNFFSASAQNLSGEEKWAFLKNEWVSLSEFIEKHSQIALSDEHSADFSPSASSPPGQSSTHVQGTCLDQRVDSGIRQQSYMWCFIFSPFLLLTCSSELWL